MLTGRRLTGDRGSSLMLMPAAVLVMLVLGAMAADLGHLHGVQRDLIAVADSVANDAVTYGLDVDALRRGGQGDYPLRRDRARSAALRSVALHSGPGRRYELVGLDVDAPARTVTITLATSVDHFFARALPGRADHADLRATGTAVAEPG